MVADETVVKSLLTADELDFEQNQPAANLLDSLASLEVRFLSKTEHANPADAGTRAESASNDAVLTLLRRLSYPRLRVVGTDNRVNRSGSRRRYGIYAWYTRVESAGARPADWIPALRQVPLDKYDIQDVELTYLPTRDEAQESLALLHAAVREIAESLAALAPQNPQLAGVLDHVFAAKDEANTPVLPEDYLNADMWPRLTHAFGVDMHTKGWKPTREDFFWINVHMGWVGSYDPGYWTAGWTYHRRFRRQGIDLIVMVSGGKPSWPLCEQTIAGVRAALDPLERLEERRTEETEGIPWNDDAQAEVLTPSGLARLRRRFPAWKVQQITWPSEDEIRSHAGVASQYDTDSCVEWLAMFLNDDYLPAALKEHLVPMRQWGLVHGDQADQGGRLCDVFIVRFEKTRYVIHIQDSPSNVVIAVEDKTRREKPAPDHEAFVIRTAKASLREPLLPGYPAPIVRGRAITTVSWNPPSVVTSVGPGYRRTISSLRTREVGTALVIADTDGRFVRFQMTKDFGGPRPRRKV